MKACIALGGAMMLASAFVLSVVFLTVGLAVVLTVGGYLWWRTRDLRRQMRARTQGQPPASGQVIEGEVIRAEEMSRNKVRR